MHIIARDITSCVLLVKCLLTAQLHSLHIGSILKFLRNQVQEPMITEEKYNCEMKCSSMPLLTLRTALIGVLR